MYDTEKAKQLEKQSHVRGALSKEFYYGEQSQLQKKRREMKRILDEQVEQRKRQKQIQKQQIQKKQRKQQEQIRRYYEDVIQRERRLSQNSSMPTNNQKGYLSDNSSAQNQSLVKKHYQQSLKQRVNSKATLQQNDLGNIPLMPVMALSQGQMNSHAAGQYLGNQQNQHFYNNFDRQNAGNIPLLDLSDETMYLKSKKKSKTQFKRQKTQRQNNLVKLGVASSSIKIQDSRNIPHHQSYSNGTNVLQQNPSLQSLKKKQRRKTLSDEQNNSLIQQNIMNSRVSKGSKVQENFLGKSPAQTKRNTEMQIPEQIEQMQNENRALKSQLKKSQEAISLLIGAVRSNPKLDKFRVQAERILHNSQNNPKAGGQQIKIVEKKEQSPLLLPKLKIKHQSIMHDYLIQAAKKARMKHIKSQASKY